MLSGGDLDTIEEIIVDNTHEGFGSLVYVDMEQVLIDMSKIGYKIVKRSDDNEED